MFAADTPARDAENYPEMGAPMDHNDHPAMDLPEPGHSPRMEHSTKMAGDVISIPGEKSMGLGPDTAAFSAYSSNAKGGKVQSIRTNSKGGASAKDYLSRLKGRVSGESDFNY